MRGTCERPIVPAFAGSLEGHRGRQGVLFTTSQFSAEARDYVGRSETKIVLIDGPERAHLMIDCGVGVADVAEYQVRKVDVDYIVNGEKKSDAPGRKLTGVDLVAVGAKRDGIGTLESARIHRRGRGWRLRGCRSPGARERCAAAPQAPPEQDNGDHAADRRRGVKRRCRQRHRDRRLGTHVARAVDRFDGHRVRFPALQPGQRQPVMGDVLVVLNHDGDRTGRAVARDGSRKLVGLPLEIDGIRARLGVLIPGNGRRGRVRGVRQIDGIGRGAGARVAGEIRCVYLDAQEAAGRQAGQHELLVSVSVPVPSDRFSELPRRTEPHERAGRLAGGPAHQRDGVAYAGDRQPRDRRTERVVTARCREEGILGQRPDLFSKRGHDPNLELAGALRNVGQDDVVSRLRAPRRPGDIPREPTVPSGATHIAKKSLQRTVRFEADHDGTARDVDDATGIYERGGGLATSRPGVDLHRFRGHRSTKAVGASGHDAVSRSGLEVGDGDLVG
ncbi:MAG: restriction endonuclease [Candidatus Schekmanbacteria bacterium]|nr:restriction endonuclease [Candidatus Schekmanbacteria bacterium]